MPEFDRQATFSGTKEVTPSLAFDVARLADEFLQVQAAGAEARLAQPLHGVEGGA